jgi:tripartite-type tricarboxylate transporter receptor subunit TctC
MVVPFPTGAPPDVGIRLVSTRLSELWGQQIVVDNRPGAAGNIGTAMVARAAPDGHTVLMAAFTHAVNVFLYDSTGYDPIADFAPVTLLSEQPCVMVVPTTSPAHTVSDFIAHAKANRGRINFASAGHGSAPHLCGELFKRAAGIDMVHVPFRSGAQQDLVAGRVDVFFAVAGAGITLALSGRARALAITGTRRIAAARHVPTIAESGFPGFDVATWWGLFAPARTPARVVSTIHADTVKVLAEPGIKSRLESLGSTVIGSTPAELGRHVRAEMAKWGPVIRDAGITVAG